MFVYDLPIVTRSYFDADGKFKFDPPVYEQRYCTVVRLLEDFAFWNCKFKKVVDFGCSEMRLLPLLRNTNGVEHILAVDIDKLTLVKNLQFAQPLLADYLRKRDAPLRIEVLAGSISDPAEQLKNVDAVIAIEVIEHLHSKELDAVPENIFGFIQPRLAIFTTPNEEFNVMFNPLLANGMRHLDHKFEWTRAQFKEWAQNICSKYKNYDFALVGLGVPPANCKNDIGHCTQVAIFARKDLLKQPLIQFSSSNINLTGLTKYQEMYAVDFPFEPDTQTQESKIWDEAEYHIERLKRMTQYYDQNRKLYRIPIGMLLHYTTRMGGDDKQLRVILPAHGIQVEGDLVLAPEHTAEYEQEEQGHDFNHDDDDDDDGMASNASNLRSEKAGESSENWDD